MHGAKHKRTVPVCTAVRLIKKRFAGTIIGLDNRVFVNGASADEYGHPSKDITDDIRVVKMRASSELDNIVDAGRNRRNIPDGADGHYHPSAVGGFDHLDTIFKVAGEYFSGVVNFEVNKRGYLFKDLTKVKNITQDIVSSYGINPKSRFLRDVSRSSIRTDEVSVNPSGENNFEPRSERDRAERDADYLAAVERGDKETAQRMVDEAAKKRGFTRKVYHGTMDFGFTRRFRR